MLKKLRKSKIQRSIAAYFLLSFLAQLFTPTAAMALTTGPGQEEFASFEPATTTDMVDLYSGDYNYNIPLLSVPGPNGGYPINIAYHSGVGMEQEASWVGLGWSLNVGAINRNLRGLPDDFRGDIVQKIQHVKDDVTASLDLPINSHSEFLGFPEGGGDGGSSTMQLYYNTYKGMGIRYSYGYSLGSAPLGLNMTSDSQNGVGLNLNIKTQGRKRDLEYTIGLNFNSRQGLQSFNFSKTHRSKTVSSLSFATVFGVPKVNMKMKSTTVPFTLRIGTGDPVFRFTSSLPIEGSVFTSKGVNNGVDNIPALGYLNTTGQSNAMRDFSREDVMYSKTLPHLPSSSFTYDVYTQTGQGTGSMFRPHLNVFGVLSDAQKINQDNIAGGGLEVGVGGTLDLHIGVDIQYGEGQNSSGKWMQIENKNDWGSGLGSLLSWASANTKIDYEPYYFQVIGEKTGYHYDEEQLSTLGDDRAVRLKIEKETGDDGWLNRHFKLTDDLITNETGSTVATFTGMNNTRQQGKRVKRATSIETLNTVQSQQYGYSKHITYYDSTATTPATHVKDFTKPSQHISEVSMLQPDGMRYVYGLPTYNNRQADNLFAVKEDNGLAVNIPSVPIHTGSIGGINVSGTHDEFVSKSELPKYAQSWLLTQVLSADYLDVTGNGPTDDDFGYWVKFNYKKIYSNYKWRAPYADANFIDGEKTNAEDNKGSYQYGEKEIYVLASIETKTHIAVFETSGRKDTYEAANEYAGGRGSRNLRKLDKISLYTKGEYALPGAVPTKVINFAYNYELCPGVPNNNGTAAAKDIDGVSTTPMGPDDVNYKKGKLTLKKLFFTYQNSTRGALSPYVFNYGNANDPLDNPAYNKMSLDRWGNYKNENAYKYTIPGTSTQAIAYPYTDHPYTEQDPEYYHTTGADGYRPGPWTLKEISLPTGGTMAIKYELDDYAYVENKQATRMFDICYLDGGIGGPAGVATLADGVNRKIATPVGIGTEPNSSGRGGNRVYFKLEKKMIDLRAELNLTGSGLNDNELFRKLYLENLTNQYLYFDIFTNLKDQYYDNVKGYGELLLTSGGVNYGVVVDPSSSEPDYGYFTLKKKELATPLNTLGLWVSPFTRYSLEHLRANRSELVFESIPYGGTGAIAQIMSLFNGLFTQYDDFISAGMGFNNYAYQNGWAQNIQLNGRSTVKLCDPNYRKIGGGIRVKEITLNDNWRNNPSVAANSSYGQKYSYTKTIILDGREVTISSGVAYEPRVGAEESALRSPVPYTRSIPLHGSYNLFMENPIMDNYYPGESVGYSKITVESIAPDKAKEESTVGAAAPTNNLSYSAAPVNVYEFYTPKDFPVIFSKTDMNPGQPIRIPLMIPGVFSSNKTRQAKSQGYSLILNDMAGKPKAVTTKTRNGGQVISSQQFVYNTESAYNEDAVNKLSSKVQTLETDENYQIKYVTSIVGQSSDMFVDMNEDAQSMESFGLETNFDMHYTPPAGIAMMFVPIPTVSFTEGNMRTVVFNKIINRTGILKKVETTNNGSKIITENLAFDIDTGDPLLTKITNEFKDPLYNFSFPGHWYYPNMGGAYQNAGLKIGPYGSSTTLSDVNGYLPMAPIVPSGRNISEFFAKGDLLFVDCSPLDNIHDGQYHVFNIDKASNKIMLINSSGHLFPPGIHVESLKVLKSGFRNMQSVEVGSLAFKENPHFVDHVPGTSPTALTNLDLVNGVMDNKIIAASATEYSNDWQVFAGPLVPWEEECICNLNPCAYDFLALLQSFQADDILLERDILLYDEEHNVYFNGFNADLLNASPALVDMVHAFGNTQIYCQGYVDAGDLYLLFSSYGHIVHGTDFTEINCAVKLTSPDGNIWHNIQSFDDIRMNAGTEECAAPEVVNLDATMKDETHTTFSLEVVTQEECDVRCGCWSFEECYTKIIPNYACGITMCEAINPYLAGMKGMWRPKASYVYKTARTQNDNVKDDGAFTDFVRFPWEDPSLKDAKWINANTITKYSPFGFELENQDALGNYSSALYRYKQSLVTAIASNAGYNEIAYDNFEDYPLGCNDEHFKFVNITGHVNKNFAHTGKYSVEIPYGASAIGVEANTEVASAYAPIDDHTNPTVPADLPAGCPSPEGGIPNAAHFVEPGDVIGIFAPKKNKKYVLSAWVKEATAGPDPVSIPGKVEFTTPKLVVTITSAGGTSVNTFSAKGNIIDGWQQIFETFEVPATATTVKIEMVNSAVSGSASAYFDDIRVHPFDANMVTYAYDPITLKTMAELDANNYATIYVYDDEGHLNKVKKETTAGIKTVKEGRVNLKKYNE